MGKKGSKKGGLQLPGLRMDQTEINIDLTCQIETLERELLVKQRIEENLRASSMLLRDRAEQQTGDFEQERDTTRYVTSDMARQYKALEEDLIHKINTLETTLTEQKEELDMTKHEMQELCRDKDDILQHKDRVIAELKTRTDQMCTEFHDMLNTTLKLMKDHMAAKLNQDPEAQAEQETKMKVQQEGYAQKLQDFATKAYAAISAAK